MSENESTLTATARVVISSGGYAMVSFQGDTGTHLFVFPTADIERWLPLLKIVIEASLSVIEGVDTQQPPGYA